MSVPHGVPGEAAGLRTPAASHRPLPYFGYVRWVKFKLFVHYSFIIRSLFVLIRASILDRKRGLGVSPEGSRGSLGGSWGGPVALLEGSWGVRGRFRSRLFGYEILRRFFDPILIQKGRPRGGIWEAFWEPRWFQNRSKIHIKIQEQKKRLLNAIWHRFGTCRRAKTIEKPNEKQ